MNVGTFGREKPQLLPAEVQIGFSQRDAGHGTQLGINFQQQLDVLLDRRGEWINLEWRSPFSGDRLFRSHLDIVDLHPPRRFGDLNGASGSSFNAGPGEIIRGGKTPGAVRNYTHPETE